MAAPGNSSFLKMEASTMSSYDSSQLVLGSVLLAGAAVAYRYISSSESKGVPYKMGIPFIGSWDFFTRRTSFLNDGLQRLGDIFAFNIVQHKVIAAKGEDARKVVFSDKTLSFTQGYQILFGGSPDLKDINVETHHENERARSEWFSKRISSVLRRERLGTTLPLMFQDLDRIMQTWGDSGSFDPFDKIYNTVFQLTIRAASCREVADDPEAVKQVRDLYWLIEKGSTPTSVLLPWLPSRARKTKKEATTALYMIIKKHVDARKAEGREESDAMQLLMDEGDSPNQIVEFVMGTLFAGIITTGIMSSWITLFLQVNPEWKAKAVAEVREFISKYASAKSEGTRDESLASQLAQVPPQIWDDGMPVLDVILRETIRVVLSGAFLRRSMQEGLTLNGHEVDPGTFIAFPVSSVHHNPDIYADPLKWDPSRYERGEDRKENFGFVGWGAGRHPCLGMRFAKLEVKAIMAMFLTMFESEAVDASGKPVTVLPEPARDNLFQAPPVRPVYVKYTRISS